MPVPTLHRLAAIAGMLCAFAICFNAARRGGLVPSTDLARAAAPLAQLFGLWLLTGLYTSTRERTGVLGLAGYALNSLGLAGLVGCEYVVNFVLPFVPPATVADLLDGLAGAVFTGTQAVLLVGALLFAAALARGGHPPVAVALYAIGAVAIGLRGVLPDVTLNPGLVLAATGLAWLAAALYRSTERTATVPTH
ncbi:hypothetical protein [Pseudonocardia cypriaca]|uniref:Uncharacterized protein n=1 Tax=Pseudonocardia cypriaca TaxID=882449 RepID=A0A543FMI0_9PSEU|nr:hypothetical protein [Pseudonocardia cypriaca]TQM35079.1 hypothetical protein FB388_6505 [Pseudonocardia cypriaca]